MSDDGDKAENPRSRVFRRDQLFTDEFDDPVISERPAVGARVVHPRLEAPWFDERHLAHNAPNNLTPMVVDIGPAWSTERRNRWLVVIGAVLLVALAVLVWWSSKPRCREWEVMHYGDCIDPNSILPE